MGNFVVILFVVLMIAAIGTELGEGILSIMDLVEDLITNLRRS